MFLNITPRSCVKSWERMERDFPSKTRCRGRASAHFRSLQHALLTAPLRQGPDLFFLSPLIVALYPLGQNIKHNYSVHCSLTSLRERFSALVAYSPMAQGFPAADGVGTQAALGAQGTQVEDRVEHGAHCGYTRAHTRAGTLSVALVVVRGQESSSFRSEFQGEPTFPWDSIARCKFIFTSLRTDTPRELCPLFTSFLSLI